MGFLPPPSRNRKNVKIIDLAGMSSVEAQYMLNMIDADRAMKKVDDELEQLDPEFAKEIRSSYIWEGYDDVVVFSGNWER